MLGCSEQEACFCKRPICGQPAFWVLIPGWGRSPGGGNGNPPQYPHLENPMDRRAWQATVHGVTKSRTRLSDQHISAFPGCVVNTQINLNQLNEPCVLQPGV